MSKIGLVLALAALIGAGAAAILVGANSSSNSSAAVVKSTGKSCCDGH